VTTSSVDYLLLGKAAREPVDKVSVGHAREPYGSGSNFLAAVLLRVSGPIQVIVGYTELLTFGVGGELSDGQRRGLETIRRQCQVLLDIIREAVKAERGPGKSLDLRRRELVERVELLAAETHDEVVDHLIKQVEFLYQVKKPRKKGPSGRSLDKESRLPRRR
jgi:signal transduction histidine kinase